MDGSTASENGRFEPKEYDIVTIGETMVAFVSRDDPRHYRAVIAGAESNVAVGTARLGLKAQWVSRLGDDPLGRFIEESITAGGVEVAVVRSGDRPTGAMTKHVSESGTRSQYYRSESAARELSADDLHRAGSARWMHVTGITPALSTSAAGLVEAVLDRRAGHEGGVSLDVNYRPALWPDAATAAEVLPFLARRADVVFVGDDEAGALFGTAEAGALGDLFLRRDDQELVIKQGAAGASVVTRRGKAFEPALAADVVDPTGAGDAFAAGYLAGRLFGWEIRARLRLGHFMGSRVVGVLEDVVPPLEAAEREGLSPETLAARWVEPPQS